MPDDIRSLQPALDHETGPARSREGMNDDRPAVGVNPFQDDGANLR